MDTLIRWAFIYILSPYLLIPVVWIIILIKRAIRTHIDTPTSRERERMQVIYSHMEKGSKIFTVIIWMLVLGAFYIITFGNVGLMFFYGSYSASEANSFIKPELTIIFCISFCHSALICMYMVKRDIGRYIKQLEQALNTSD